MMPEGLTAKSQVERTSPGSKLDFRITYDTGAQKWTDDRPGDGVNPERQRELEEKFSRPSVKRGVRSLERAVGGFLDSGRPQDLAGVASSLRTNLGVDVATDVVRQVHKAEKGKLKGLEGDAKGRQQAVVDAVGAVRDELTRKKASEVRAVLAVARELVASKQILFHGTALKNLRKILKVGLIPDAGQRAWGEDPQESLIQISRQSYFGTYLTKNVGVAISSASHTSTESGVIVAVQAETKTLLPDEDELIGALERSVRHLIGEPGWVTSSKYVEMLSKPYAYVEPYVDGILKEWFTEINKQGFGGSRRTRARIERMRPLVEDLLWKLVRRQISWVMVEEDAKEPIHRRSLRRSLEDAGYDPDREVPTTSKAKAEFRKAFSDLMDRAGILVENLASDWYGDWYKARAVEPISYRGANRVLAVVSYQYLRDENKNQVVVHYSRSPAAVKAILAGYESLKSKNYELVAA